MADQPVWREIARALRDQGAVRCFGLVGGANFKVTHALTASGIPFTAARHEGGAVTMADASARLTGDLIGRQRDGGTRADQCHHGNRRGRQERHAARGPGGDVPVGDLTSSFSIRQQDLVRSVGAHWVQIDTPSGAYGACARRRPAPCASVKWWSISLPVDVAGATDRRRSVVARLPRAAARPPRAPSGRCCDRGRGGDAACGAAAADPRPVTEPESPMRRTCSIAWPRRSTGCSRPRSRPTGCSRAIPGTRHRRGLCLARRRGADPAERSRHRLRRVAQHVDDEEGTADPGRRPHRPDRCPRGAVRPLQRGRIGIHGDAAETARRILAALAANGDARRSAGARRRSRP